MTPYDPDIGAKVVERVADGQGLLGACVALGVARRSVRDWVTSQPDFAKTLAEARRQGLEVLADEIISIGDEVEGCENQATVQAARLRVDSRKWLLSKLHPQQYGDKVELSGADGTALFPPNPEAAVPRLMPILSVLLPGSSNSELFTLATEMARKLRQIEPPKSTGNGEDHED